MVMLTYQQDKKQSVSQVVSVSKSVDEFVQANNLKFIDKNYLITHPDLYKY